MLEQILSIVTKILERYLAKPRVHIEIIYAHHNTNEKSRGPESHVDIQFEISNKSDRDIRLKSMSIKSGKYKSVWDFSLANTMIAEFPGQINSLLKSGDSQQLVKSFPIFQEITVNHLEWEFEITHTFGKSKTKFKSSLRTQ